MRIAFESGAQQVTGGSIAVKQPEVFSKWISSYGAEKIILGADVKREYIATDGWLETSDQSLFDFLTHYQARGIQYTICTDISKDGMLQGPSFDLYQKIIAETQVKLIASGGISQFDELPRLAEMGCEGTIIGKAIYENRISLKQLENFIVNRSTNNLLLDEFKQNAIFRLEEGQRMIHLAKIGEEQLWEIPVANGLSLEINYCISAET